MYEIIKKDDDFWNKNMETKLKDFYLKHLLPVLIKEDLT